MAKANKTTESERSVSDFINEFVISAYKKKDSYQLIELMKEWSGFEPRMWGPSIIGFGRYHYKYASGHEGDAPLIGFSPRKSSFSLYVSYKIDRSELLLEEFGKHKMGKSCIYFNKLSDINITILEKLCRESIAYLNENHECACKEN
jgi:hypothetical protein